MYAACCPKQLLCAAVCCATLCCAGGALGGAGSGGLSAAGSLRTGELGPLGNTNSAAAAGAGGGMSQGAAALAEQLCECFLGGRGGGLGCRGPGCTMHLGLSCCGSQMSG